MGFYNQMKKDTKILRATENVKSRIHSVDAHLLLHLPGAKDGKVDRISPALEKVQ